MLRWFLASIALAATVSTSTAAYVLNVVPAVAPDRGVNPATFAAWQNNAVTGLRNVALGNTSYHHTGDPGLPTFYYPAGSYQGGGAINSLSAPFGAGVTGLWNGVANPTGAFAGQSGNWLYFGLSIRTTAGETFTAANVSFTGTNGFSPFIPSEGASGIVGGSNTLVGASTIGGPLFAINAGNQNTPLAELYYVGAGYSITNGAGDYGSPAALEALMLPPDTANAVFYAGYQLTDGVNVLASGVGGVDINGVPAPATVALMGMGLVGLVARVRRRLA